MWKKEGESWETLLSVPATTHQCKPPGTLFPHVAGNSVQVRYMLLMPPGQRQGFTVRGEAPFEEQFEDKCSHLQN